MRIGGASRDSFMLVVPLVVAAVVVLVFLGGPSEFLRAIERLTSDALDVVGSWFRR